jgi:hypothetical protein
MVAHDETQTTCWCLGLPEVDEVPLAAEERKALRGQVVWNLIGGILLVPVSLITFLGGIIALVEIDISGMAAGLMKGVLLSFLVLSALLMVLADQCLKRSKAIRGDLRAGVKRRFAGTFSSLDHLNLNDRVIRALLSADLLTLWGEQRLEVLPHSQRFWRVNDRPVRRWLTATWGQTANVPEHAAIAAEWLDQLPDVEDCHLAAGTRELTETEKADIRRYAHSRWRDIFWPTLLLTIWAFPLLGYAIYTHRWPTGWDGVMFLVLNTLAVLCLVMFILGVIGAAALLRDVRGDRVNIVRVTPPESSGEEITIEWLPHSRIIWTTNGAPTEWRKYTP